MKTRRRAILRVQGEFLRNLITNGEIHVKVRNGLPKDAFCRGIYFDSSRDCFDLVYESKKFKPVPKGERTPLLPSPIVTDIRMRANVWRKLYRLPMKFYLFLRGIFIGIGDSIKFFLKKESGRS